MLSETDLTIVNASVRDTISTLTISAGCIRAIEPNPTSTRGPTWANRDNVLDLDGAVVLPGLHDHHLHLFALASATDSLDCGPDAVAPGQLASALDNAVLTDGWVRGTGYFETVHGDLDRDVLDALRSDVPVRIQHRSGVAWFVNSAGLERLGLGHGPPPEGVELDDHGRPTGRLFRLDDWMAERVGRRTIDLGATSLALASFGVTTVTDATPYATAAELGSLVAQRTSGAIRQRLITMGAPSVNEVAGLHRGAAKIVLDEASMPSLDDLCARINAAHRLELPAAVHITDRSTLWLALAAWQAVGVRPGDRIEHGAVMDPAALGEVASLGLVVVTNPALASRRGDDHARHTEVDDLPHLWRCGSLVDAGIRTLGGTDAPYGSADPWESMRAAVDRRTPSGRAIGSDRRLKPDEALALFSWSTAVDIGMRADLLVATGSADEIRTDLSSKRVVHTIVDGRLVWSR